MGKASYKPKVRVHCKGKIRHTSMEQAEEHAAMVRADKGWQLYPYKCSMCAYYHIGHKPRARSVQRATTR